MLLPVVFLLLSVQFITADRGRITHKHRHFREARCGNPIPRREWRALNSQEQSKFIEAVLNLQQSREGGVSEYELFAQSHGDNSTPIHGVACFLPWHRYFLYQYERALQEVSGDPNLRVPFWAWQLDSQAPEASPIWRSFGGDGVNGCVRDGPFASFKPRFIEPNSGLPNCLARQFNGGANKGRIGALDSPETLNLVLSSSQHFTTVAPALEGRPHAMTHNNIGGMMQTMYSPNDPVFYLHHSNLDKLWYDWQQLSTNNAQSYGGMNFDRSRASLSDVLPIYPGIRVSDVMDTKKLCYTYETLTRQVVEQKVQKQIPKPKIPPNPVRQQRKQERRTIRGRGGRNGHRGQGMGGGRGINRGHGNSRNSNKNRKYPRHSSNARGNGNKSRNPNKPYNPDKQHKPYNPNKPQKPQKQHKPYNPNKQHKPYNPNKPQKQNKPRREYDYDRLVRRSAPVVAALPAKNAHGQSLLPPLPADIKPCDSKVKVEAKPEGSSAVGDDNRSDLLKLRIPAALPEAWLAKNGLNVTLVRQQELVLNNCTYSVNHIPGFISPAALYERPDLLGSVIAKAMRQPDKPDGKKFMADIGKERVVVNYDGQDPLQAAADVRARLKESVQNPDAFHGLMVDIAPALAKVIGPPACSANSAANPFSVKNATEDTAYGRDNKGDLPSVQVKPLSQVLASVNPADIEKQKGIAQQRQTTVRLTTNRPTLY